MHYQRWRRHGDVTHTRTRVVDVAQCTVEECANVIKARGWCAGHWNRWKRHGSPTARVRAEVIDGKRICPSCSEDKPLAEWTKGECKACARERAGQYRVHHPYVCPSTLPLICDGCGEQFVGNKRRRRYCSKDCSDLFKHKANWVHLTARRARLRHAFVETFDRLEIFQRDGWICGLCELPVDPALSWPDPMSPSLDHIVPIALGGKHSRANAQCTHLTCNVHKGARLAESARAA